jgi:transposase
MGEYLGKIANDPGAISKWCDRLGRPGKPLVFCCESRPQYCLATHTE